MLDISEEPKEVIKEREITLDREKEEIKDVKEEVKDVKKEIVEEKEEKQKIEKKKEKIVKIKKIEFEILQEKSKEAEKYYNWYLRAKADFENLKKRVNREKIELIKYANEDLIFNFLPVIDNFERAYFSAQKIDNYQKLCEGIEIIIKQLREVLKNKGLEIIPALGEKFDPIKHEAVMYVVSDKYPENTIIEEIEKGYILGDKVIRASKVTVSKKKEGEITLDREKEEVKDVKEEVKDVKKEIVEENEEKQKIEKKKEKETQSL